MTDTESFPLTIGSNSGGWNRDHDGKQIYIIGFPDAPLRQASAVVELELLLDGKLVPAKLSLVRSTTNKVVHSTWEAVMGI